MPYISRKAFYHVVSRPPPHTIGPKESIFLLPLYLRFSERFFQIKTPPNAMKEVEQYVVCPRCDSFFFFTRLRASGFSHRNAIQFFVPSPPPPQSFSLPPYRTREFQRFRSKYGPVLPFPPPFFHPSLIVFEIVMC